MKIIKRTLITAYLLMTLSLGIVYAASAGSLSYNGIVFVQEWSADEDEMFQVFPLTDNDGNYFTSLTLPQGLDYGEVSWEGLTFSLVVLKGTPPNNGNQNINISFRFVNPTNYSWIKCLENGTTTTLGALNVVTRTNPLNQQGNNNSMLFKNPNFTSPNTLAAGAMGVLSMNYSGKISATVSDGIQLDLCYKYNLSGHGDVIGKIHFIIEFRGNPGPVIW